MKIQPVSFPIQNSRKLSTVQNRQITSAKQDKISFTGYEGIMTDVVRTTYKHANELEKPFEDLIISVLNDKTFSRTAYFYDVYKIFAKKGFYGTLQEFWRAHPVGYAENIVSASEQDNVILAKKGNDVIMSITNWGRHGFWNAIADSKDAPRDIRINFFNQKQSLEFSLDKHGDIEFAQTRGDYEFTSWFYNLTGNLKKTVESSGISTPEATYYNKNGTKAFWKNFLYGGKVAEPIY